MGYTMHKGILTVLDSDGAADFVYGLGQKLISLLRKQEKVKENTYNTDGILNVALTIQDCFNSKGWSNNPLIDYAESFIPRFEKWIEQQTKAEWDDEINRAEHLKAYRNILSNIKRIVKDNMI